MHKDLDMAFQKVVDILKKDRRCLGGWHFGSISRGEEDIYSDYDPVFLIKEEDFESFALDMANILNEACDELILFWPEDFNDDNFKNFCSIIRIGSNLHQFDIFLINKDRPNAWMCKLHSQGCSKEHIIFDRTGDVAFFLEGRTKLEKSLPDTIRAMDTYWFHIEMLIKYFKRKDSFKILRNIDILLHAHVDLLLSYYDTLDWGGWESKVKKCVPQEKQKHLLAYYVRPDFLELENMIKKNMIIFKKDADEICKLKGISYSDSIGDQIMKYFLKMMDS